LPPSKGVRIVVLGKVKWQVWPRAFNRWESVDKRERNEGVPFIGKKPRRGSGSGVGTPRRGSGD